MALGALGPIGIVFMINEAIGTLSPNMLSIGLVFVWVSVTATAMLALARSFWVEEPDLAGSLSLGNQV